MEARVRILMVHPHDIYDDLEPWTVRMTYLAKEIVHSGNDVKLIYHLREAGEDEETAYRRQEYPFETVPFPRFIPSLTKRCLKMGKLAHWADLVHFQKCAHYAALPAIFSALYHRRPIHYDWDDWEQKIYEMNVDYSKIGSWIFFQQMERHIIKTVDTISVSSSGLKTLTNRFGFPQDRVFHVPVGADLDMFSPEVDGKALREQNGWNETVVLYQGQISGANYVHLFLKAASIILSKRRDAVFVVVGGGDHLKKAMTLARELNLLKHVKFIGAIPHRSVPEFLAAADIAVACFENNEQTICKSPLKLAEYMASGKAIVANRMGEVPFMLEGCGILIDDERPESFAAAINRLLDYPEFCHQLGRRARKRAEKVINWRKSADTLIEAYEKAFLFRYGIKK